MCNVFQYCQEMFVLSINLSRIYCRASDICSYITLRGSTLVCLRNYRVKFTSGAARVNSITRGEVLHATQYSEFILQFY